MLTFPQGFLWGAATAAHQIEGNNVNSNWWPKEHAPGTTMVEPSGDAADSFHRYREDIKLLADLGLDTYRFSIEWARIEPERGFTSRSNQRGTVKCIRVTIGSIPNSRQVSTIRR